jgi:hypothetical protein
VGLLLTKATRLRRVISRECSILQGRRTALFSVPKHRSHLIQNMVRVRIFCTTLGSRALVENGHHQSEHQYLQTLTSFDSFMAMAELANELQDMIIDFLHDDQDSLRACSLVSPL